MDIKRTDGRVVGSCEHNGIKIDLGAGRKRTEGFLGVDITPSEHADFVRDLAKGLPFCNRSVEIIKAHNILEHLGDEFEFVMRECWRVLKDGGTFDISVPGAFSDGGMRDPTHKRHFMRSTFDYFTKHRPKYHSYLDDAKWKVLTLEGANDGIILVTMTPDRD